MLKRIAREIYLDLVGSFKKPEPGIHILNGHYLSRKNMNSEPFRRLLRFLNGSCRLIRIEKAVSLITQGTTVSESLVAFTFDDGFEECATRIAPVLEEFGINAAFFINPGFVEGNEEYRVRFLNHVVYTADKKPMNWEQIKNLHQKGHVIGSHTQDHKRLIGDDNRLFEEQICQSKKRIEDQIQQPCDYFAFPYGKLNDLSEPALAVAQRNHQYIFSQSNYQHYFSFGGRVINRRHFEPDWKISHVHYFLSKHKRWD